MSVALWIVQILLAALFLFAGGMKLAGPIDQTGAPVQFPNSFLVFIGVVEVLGAAGLILPAMLRIAPGLTPLAALGLVILMAGAVVTGLIMGALAASLIPLAVGLLAAFVAWGRWRRAPIASRSGASRVHATR
jgi:putative oxidoreductase